MKLAVIPARGGSKRIPKKNIRSFGDQPMLAYSITAASQSGLFDKIIVSTDDEEIADVAKKYGADVPFMRPETLADDFTGTNAVVKHAIEWHQQHQENPEFVCCIYATAPFLQEKYLRRGYEQLLASNKAFAFSVTHYPFPVQRALRVNEDESVAALYPENRNTRSQDLEEIYHDAGQFYWGRAEAFLKDEVMFSSAALAVKLPPYLVQDIDTEDDWKRAELMYYAWNKSSQ